MGSYGAIGYAACCTYPEEKDPHSSTVFPEPANPVKFQPLVDLSFDEKSVFAGKVATLDQKESLKTTIRIDFDPFKQRPSS